MMVAKLKNAQSKVDAVVKVINVDEANPIFIYIFVTHNGHSMAGLHTIYIIAFSFMHLALVSGRGAETCRPEQARFRIVLLSIQ